MPELTFTVMLLEESLLKTEGTHKSLGLKERLGRARITGQRFARLSLSEHLAVGTGVVGQANPQPALAPRVGGSATAGARGTC